MKRKSKVLIHRLKQNRLSKKSTSSKKTKIIKPSLNKTKTDVLYQAILLIGILQNGK
jgi:hypothetical protein